MLEITRMTNERIMTHVTSHFLDRLSWSFPLFLLKFTKASFRRVPLKFSTEPEILAVYLYSMSNALTAPIMPCCCLMAGSSEHLLPLSLRDFQLTKEMVMEKPSAQLVGREFVRQYYTLLNQAPDYLHRYACHATINVLIIGFKSGKRNNFSVPVLRFYGKNSSYVHGGLDSNGKPVEAVYGQSVSGLHHPGGRKALYLQRAEPH